MAKQMIEIDVPDGYEVVDYRKPCPGEEYLSAVDGRVRRVESIFVDVRPIVRPAWKWPKWLKAPWIALDSDGEWCTHRHEPFVRYGLYWDDGHGAATHLDADLFDFTPPPCTEWKQSKRRNPNYEAT